MLRRLFLGLALALAAPAAGLAQTTAALLVNVIPEPLSVEAPPAGAADPVQVADGTPVIVPRGDAPALEVARYLAELALRTRGLRLAVQVGGRPPEHASAILIERRGAAAPGEGYELQIGSDRVTLAAADAAGLFYGAGTLWQLLTPDAAHGPVALQPVRIHDSPRFAWRGLMLDSARHYQPPAEIERIIDAMALHKLNVLHWHLTDDQAWRLQILKYPRLTEVGGWRTPAPGSADSTGDGRPYGGVYSQDDARRIVAYAAARHVTIVPEIEMPGHALSAVLAYPALGAGAPALAADQSRWGGFSYVYNLDEATFGFIDDVLTEVMALFPGRYVHVGGDEAVKERWQSPELQARMRALGVTDVTALQSYFTGRIARFLQAHGRRLVGWDEILQGGDLPSDAVVMSWHGPDGALAAATAGHDVILAPAPMLYFDNRQGDGPAEPPGRGPVIALGDVYAFEPAPAALAPQVAGHILGLQGNLWTEHVRTSAQVEAMFFPRAAAVAETGWSAPERRSWTGFTARLPAQFARYAALGIGADPAAVAIRIEANPGPGGALVALSSQAGLGEIRYTADGTAPTSASPRYDQPFAVPLPTRLRAAAFLDGAAVSPEADRRLDALSIRRRASQELKLCNDKLALNLEGAGAPDGARPAYLINPLDACWIYPAADLTGIARVTVAVGRLPFIFGLDPAHNTVMAHPPRQPTGELEVRQDSCVAEPIAVVPLRPAAAGAGDDLYTADLPPRTGAHDLCFTFTSAAYDPVHAVDWVQLVPAGGGG